MEHGSKSQWVPDCVPPPKFHALETIFWQAGTNFGTRSSHWRCSYYSSGPRSPRTWISSLCFPDSLLNIIIFTFRIHMFQQNSLLIDFLKIKPLILEWVVLTLDLAYFLRKESTILLRLSNKQVSLFFHHIHTSNLQINW